MSEKTNSFMNEWVRDSSDNINKLKKKEKWKMMNKLKLVESGKRELN